MKRRTYSSLIVMFVALLLVSAVIGGCGSASKESSGTPAAGVQTIGFTECYNCHADAKNPASLPVAFGDSAANVAAAIGWLNGPHANQQNGFLGDQRPNNKGFPFYGFEGLGTTPECTLICHDQLGEGKTISKFFTKTGLTVLGVVDRPVIGCESCHGGGGNHFGVGPLPYAKPDPDRCGQCHNQNVFSYPGHPEFHPEANNITPDYKASPHSRSVNEHTYVTTGDPSVIRGSCARCHTDSGAKLYLPISSGTMTYGDLGAALGSVPNITEPAAVQCRTCHDAHNPFTLLGDKDAVAPGSWFEEFKTCTSCHQLLKATGTWNTGSLNDMVYHSPVSKAGTTVNSYGSWEEIIGDTHYDDPTTPDIEGYIVDPLSTHNTLSVGNNNSGTCRDCHNEHKADNTINRQWARSGHAGFILDVKEKAAAAGGNVYTAAVTTFESLAWVEDDFKAGSNSCKRCHTATAYRRYANSQAAYVAPAASAYVAQGEQRELLYCWACHTDNVGGIRNPGAFSTGYTIPLSDYSFSGASVTFPNLNASNVCIPCHSGRRNRNYIETGSRSSTFRPHHAPTAATVFSELSHIVYEFDLDGNGNFAEHYKNVPYFEHDKIGTASVAGTGTDGPCVGCHMGGSSHLFSAITESAGLIVSINNQTLCNVCHTGQYAMSAAKLEEESEAAQEANAVLKAYVSNAIPNYLNTPITSSVTSTVDYGALQNSLYLDDGGDPGAYVHNRIYVKRIIFDSIDRLDTGTFEGNIVINATTYPKAAVWFGAPLNTTGTYTASRP